MSNIPQKPYANYQAPKKNDFGQAAGLVTIPIGATLIAEKAQDLTSHTLTPKDILTLGIIGGLTTGMGYAAVTFIPPMWKEVTEFKQDKLPFYTSQIKYN